MASVLIGVFFEGTRERTLPVVYFLGHIGKALHPVFAKLRRVTEKRIGCTRPILAR